MIKSIVLCLMGILFVYFCGAVMSNNFNIMGFTEGAKFFFLYLTGVLLAGTTLFNFLNGGDK